MRASPHYLTAWWGRDEQLLGLELDEVLEGYEQAPIAPRNSVLDIELPPLTDQERAEIRRGEDERAAARVQALAELERKIARPRDRAPRVVDIAAARDQVRQRVARENFAKQARVREAIARHVAGAQR